MNCSSLNLSWGIFLSALFYQHFLNKQFKIEFSEMQQIFKIFEFDSEGEKRFNKKIVIPILILCKF